MKIHANARTCPNSRRLLVRRIEEEGWSLMVAAEAAGISERCPQVADPLAGGGRGGPAGSQLRSQASALAPAGRSPGGDRGPAAAADDRGGDRRGPWHGALDRLAVAGADRPGQEKPPGASRATQPLRAQAPG